MVVPIGAVAAAWRARRMAHLLDLEPDYLQVVLVAFMYDSLGASRLDTQTGISVPNPTSGMPVYLES